MSDFMKVSYVKRFLSWYMWTARYDEANQRIFANSRCKYLKNEIRQISF